MTEPTADQKRLLDERTREEVQNGRCSTLVEAAAGTGKTTLLVSRILTGLQRGDFRLYRTVAITFTEKAAAELESRLRGELTHRLHQPDLAPDESENLRRAVEEIDRANISTIHSFCASLLRERPVEAGVDPEFDVLDETQSALLRERCWESWIGEEAQRNSGPLVDSLITGASITSSGPYGPAGLKEFAESLVKHAEVLEDDRYALARPEESEAVLGGRLVELAEEADRFIEKHMKRGNTHSRTLRRLCRTIAATPPEDRQMLRASGSELAGVKLETAIKSFARESRADGLPLFQTLQQTAKDLLAHLACELFRWVGDFAAHYAAEKTARSALDFHDLLVLSARMLKENTAARKHFQERFQAFFVDEFQDTDPLQAQIIAYLCEDAGSGPAAAIEEVELDPRKLFVVGDPKQSIYRFRRADVQIYERFKGLFARMATEQEEPLREVFRNFRSTSPLLTRLNSIFQQVFVPPEKEGVYQARHVSLVAARDAEGAGTPVVALYPPADADRGDWDAATAREHEARYLASFIHALAQERAPASAQAALGNEAASYRGIALLFRALTDVDIYEEALERARIPYRVVGGKTFYQREEIGETLALLRAIDDPLDHLSIVGALRSSYFGVSDEQLFAHREAGGRWNYLLNERREGPAGESMEALRRWHHLRNTLTPHTLMLRILDETKALEAYRRKPAGEQRAANVQKLIGQLRALHGASTGSFRSIIAYLAGLHERQEAEEESSVVEPGDQFVTLMSIHRSKGLEFDVVILPDLSRSFPSGSAPLLVDRVRERMAVRPAGGIESNGYEELADIEQANQIAEQRRLLYVAATRARRLLVLPLYWQKKDNASNCMLEFLADSGCFAEPGDVPFGEAREGVHYWDTSAIASAPAPSPAPAEPEGEAGDEELKSLLAQRERWRGERRRVLEQIGRGPRILLPSGMEGGGTAVSEQMADMPGGREFGTLFHAVMAALPLPRESDENVDSALIRRVAEQRAAEMWMGEEEAAEAFRLALDVLSIAEYRELLSGANEVQKEVPFSVPLDALPQCEGQEGYLEGNIDLLLVSGDKTVILDYKTDRVAQGERHRIAGRYWPQLSLYGLAAKACAYGPPAVELALCFARDGVLVTRGLNEAFAREELAAAGLPLARPPSGRPPE